MGAHRVLVISELSYSDCRVRKWEKNRKEEKRIDTAVVELMKKK